MLYTTLALCRKHDACESGYRKLAKHLGGVKACGKDTLIPLTVVLESNGIEDAIWSLRATTENPDRFARLFACACAERVLPIFEKKHPEDKRPRQAIETARMHANGEATVEELNAAESAAWSAARSAAGVAEREWQTAKFREMLEAKPGLLKGWAGVTK